LLRKIENEWRTVELALSTQGDINYIDWDAMWGGAPYFGVSAQYYQHPFDNPYEVVFYYTGETLPPGTIFWHTSNAKSQGTDANPTFFDQVFGAEWMTLASVETAVVTTTVIGKLGLELRKKRAKLTSKA
jgi:hypothetical protein